MTNLEAKQEAIKKAYGEYWELVKNYVNEDGWIDEKINKNKKYEILCSIPKHKQIDLISELMKIENNNGWIRIESEKDLPNDEDAIYWALKNGKIVCIELKTPINLKALFSDFLKDKITHYQQIEEPKPPIY